MDQPFLNLNKLVRAIPFLIPARGIMGEKLFDMVPDIHSCLILPGVNKRDLHQG
jgi:hypothetical protein